MTKQAWMKLREGSIIRSVRGKTSRLVISASNGCITLKSITNNSYKLWSGHIKKHQYGSSTTTYVLCDKNGFKVIRY